MTTHSSTLKWTLQHKWSLMLLLILFLASSYAIHHFKKPGQMSVIEAQAMDMDAMKAPVGTVPVQTEIVHRSDFNSTVRYTGSIAPLNEQIIYPRVDGWLQDLRVYNGDSVQAGQLIAMLDSPELESRMAESGYGHAAALSEIPVAHSNQVRMQAEYRAAQQEVLAAQSELTGAKARIRAAERKVQQAQKEVKSARASWDYWKTELRRESSLLKEGAISQQEYDSEKSQAIAAEAEVENKQAMVEEAKADLDAMRAELSNKQSGIHIARERVSAASAGISGASAEIRQKQNSAQMAGAVHSTAAVFNQYRQIRAPFSGVVTKRLVSAGTLVTPGTPILNIVQIDRVRLQANVAEADLDNIQVGSPVTATIQGSSSQTIQASVTSIAPLADQTSRTAVVEAIIPNPKHRLIPGQAVTLNITTETHPDTISVPTSALTTKEGHDAVWIACEVKGTGKISYYCTMHPEVVSDKPGICPKCNMKLEPKQIGAGKKAQLIEVTLGRSNGDRTEILSGLKENDEVITAGFNYLKEGDFVHVSQWGKNGPTKLPPPPGEAVSHSMPGHKNHSMPSMEMEGMKHDEHSQPISADKHCEKEAKTTHSSHTKMNNIKGKYTCPMHPDFVTDNPNTLCPKCNMKVVPVKN